MCAMFASKNNQKLQDLLFLAILRETTSFQLSFSQKSLISIWMSVFTKSMKNVSKSSSTMSVLSANSRLTVIFPWNFFLENLTLKIGWKLLKQLSQESIFKQERISTQIGQLSFWLIWYTQEVSKFCFKVLICRRLSETKSMNSSWCTWNISCKPGLIWQNKPYKELKKPWKDRWEDSQISRK